MKLCTKILIITILASGPVLAEGLDPACLQSFDVQDRMFTSENQSISCALVEQSRAELFREISAIESSSQLELQRKLAAWQAEYDAARADAENDYSTFVKFVVNNSLASIGLIACAETAGGGCALAVIAFVWGKYTAIESLVDEQKIREESRAMLRKIDALRQVAMQGPNLIDARERMTSDFNNLCTVVRQSCL